MALQAFTQLFPETLYPELQESSLYLVPLVEQLEAVTVHLLQLPLAGHEDSV